MRNVCDFVFSLCCVILTVCLVRRSRRLEINAQNAGTGKATSHLEAASSPKVPVSPDVFSDDNEAEEDEEEEPTREFKQFS